MGDGNGTADFTISHFARLCLILRDKDKARLAHAGTGQPLTKGQQHNRLSRSEYWETVAERFHDATVTPQVDMQGGSCWRIGPSLAPTTPEPGGRLKEI